jgi:DNA-binding phage protein
MAINRFDRPGRYDYNMEHFVPNFQLWDKMIGQLQLEKDTTSNLAAEIPNYIKADEKKFTEYTQANDQNIDDITEQYMNGNMAIARRQQRELMNRLTRDRKPGGDFFNFERRVKERAAAMKDLKERYKDAPADYQNYYYNKLDKSITPGALDESISAPIGGEYLDVLKEWDDRLQGWKSDKGTMTKVGNHYIYKETQEEVTEAEIRDALRTISSLPRYSEQLGIESEIASGMIKQKHIDNYNNALDDQVNSYEKELKAGTEGFTKEGLDQLKNRNKTAKVNDAMELARKLTFSQYAEPLADKYSFKKYSMDIKVNPEWLESKRARNNKLLMESLTAEFRPGRVTTVTTPIVKQDYATVMKKKEDANAGYLESLAALEEHMGNIKLQDGRSLGDLIPASDASYVLKAYQRSNGDKEEFASLLAKRSNSGYNVDIAQSANEIYDLLTPDEDRDVFTDHVRAVAGSEKIVNGFDRIETNARAQFNQSTQGNTFWQNQYNKHKAKLGDDIGSPEELRKAVEKFDDTYKSSAGGKKTSISGIERALFGNPSLMSKLKRQYGKAKDEFFENNPVFLQNKEGAGLIGQSGTVVDDMNAMGAEAYKTTNGLAYSGLEGGDLLFTSIDDVGKTFTRSEIDFETATVTMLHGKPVYFLAGKSKGKDGVPVTAYAEMNNMANPTQVADNGLLLYSGTFDTKGNPVQTGTAKQEQELGSTMYFYNAYPEFDLELNYGMTPNIHDSETFDVNVELNGQSIPYDRQFKNMTPVDKVVIKETGMPISIYTKSVNGQKRYFATKDLMVTDPQTGETSLQKTALSDPDGSPTTFMSLDEVIAAENGVANIAAKEAMLDQQLYKVASKGSQRLTKESLFGAFNVTQ